MEAASTEKKRVAMLAMDVELKQQLRGLVDKSDDNAEFSFYSSSE